jgi:hypothetical protein
LNVCGACGSDFTSVEAFDRHRVGKHDLDYPEHEDGRRCLVGWELSDLGWLVDARGRWFDPERSGRAASLLQEAA